MIKHLLSSALIAGFAAGMVFAALQFAFVERDILLAEQYESGALVHFAGASPAGGHDHAAGSAQPAADTAGAAVTDTASQEPGAQDHGAHVHGSDDGGSPFVRHGLTVLFAGLTFVSFALVMVAGYALAGEFGHRVSVKTGLLWGLAGFMAFQLAPAMGLEPELPGTLAAALSARQTWWALTALATAGGLGLIGYGRGVPAFLGGAILVSLPHVIGAPELGGFSGVAPPELASRFAAHSLGAGLIAWVALGGLLARLWNGAPDRAGA